MQSHHRRRSSKSILLPRISTNNTANSTNSSSSYNVGQHPNYGRRMTVHLSETQPDTTYLYGYALLIGTFLMFVISFYTIIASSYMPDTGVKLIDWIKSDNYYCLLLPITALVWIYAIMWNWMGMKFFRHN